MGRLSNKQAAEVKDWIKDNIQHLKGKTVPDMAGTASATLGFPVSVSSVRHLAKTFGLDWGQPRVSAKGAEKPLEKTLEQRLAEIKETLDIINERYTSAAQSLNTMALTMDRQSKLLLEVLRGGK